MIATLDDAITILMFSMRLPGLVDEDLNKEASELVVDHQKELLVCVPVSLPHEAGEVNADPAWDKVREASDLNPGCHCGNCRVMHGANCECAWRSET